MAQIPDLLFVVDVRREDTSIHEANLLEIPVVAMVDTNCDPNQIDYIIPSNDDAIRAIKLIVGKMADAVIEGQAMRKDEDPGSEHFVEYQPDTDLSDEELLGASTLAKLQTQRDEDSEAVEEIEGAEVEDAAPEAEVEDAASEAEVDSAVVEEESDGDVEEETIVEEDEA
jgi:small subunit ribosomal protein S2